MCDFFQKLIIAESAKVSLPGGREMIRRRRRTSKNLPGIARVGVEKRGGEHATWANAFRSELVQRPAALLASLHHLPVFTVDCTILKRRHRNGYKEIHEMSVPGLNILNRFDQSSLRPPMTSI